MRKFLILSAVFAAICAWGFQAQAETAQGKIKSQKGDYIVILMDDGNEMNLVATDNTTYRKKKIQRYKKGKSMRQENGYFKPLMEQDDWVEITYSPSGTPTEYIIEDVIIYDD